MVNCKERKNNGCSVGGSADGVRSSVSASPSLPVNNCKKHHRLQLPLGQTAAAAAADADVVVEAAEVPSSAASSVAAPRDCISGAGCLPHTHQASICWLWWLRMLDVLHSSVFLSVCQLHSLALHPIDQLASHLSIYICCFGICVDIVRTVRVSSLLPSSIYLAASGILLPFSARQYSAKFSDC